MECGRSRDDDDERPAEEAAPALPSWWCTSPVIAAGDIAVVGLLTPTVIAGLLLSSGLYTPLWLLIGEGDSASQAAAAAVARGEGYAGAATAAAVAALPPILAHGASLAACWVPCAFAARAFDPKASDREALAEAIWRLFLTVGVNCWVVLLFTWAFSSVEGPFNEADILAAGVDPDSLGASTSFDVESKVTRFVIDLNLDLVVEACLLVAWRLAHMGMGLRELRQVDTGRLSMELVSRLPWWL